MSTAQHVVDVELAARLPLPLAQLYVDAVDGKSAIERHQSAYYLWEATIKLAGAAAVIAYAERGEPQPEIVELLKSLARPALGVWRAYVRKLIPLLAATDPHYRPLEELLSRPRHDALPRLAGLDVVLREALEQSPGPKTVVSVDALLDRIVTYRNAELGHGAFGRRPGGDYDRIARAMAAGAAELLRRFDPLAGRKLTYVDGIVREPSGSWVADCYELAGERRRRRTSLRWADERLNQKLFPQHVYLATDEHDATTWASFQPLVVYDAEAHDVLMLNSRAGERRSDYVSYCRGTTQRRPDVVGEQRQLLTQVLKMDVTPADVERFADAAPPEETPAVAAESGTGRFIGDFEILSRLGKGAMGVVYRARQAALGRQVALKCQLQVGDDTGDQRFRREISALGRVAHPHLVRVFTSGSDGDQCYYAMELVDGATLSAVGDRLSTTSTDAGGVTCKAWRETLSIACSEARKSESGPKSNVPAPTVPVEVAAAAPPADEESRDYVAWVVEIVRQTAEAAHALHEAHVVHRDIKPGNIMVSADGKRACLMDLGLAQLLDECDGKLTRTRHFVGTLRYASPEQVLAVGKLDARSDVYSLGATLWELLALRPLFGATEQTPSPELMLKIQTEEPQPLRKFNPQASRDLEAVVMTCLQKKPSLRYASARELAADLERVLISEPTKARPAGRVRTITRSILKRRDALVRVWTFLFIAGLLGILWYERSRTPRDSQPAAGEVGPDQSVSASVVPSAVRAGPERPPGEDPAVILARLARVADLAADREATPQPASFAVVVGVTKTADLPPLRFAEKDAEDVASALLDAGFAEERVVVLTEARGAGDPARLPTKENIAAALSHAADAVERGGTLFFHFSGNGAAAGPNLDQYLLAADSRSTELESCLRVADLDRMIAAKSQAQLDLCIADACRSAHSPVGAHRGPLAAPNTFLTQPGDDHRCLWLYGTLAGQTSFESEHLRNGVFTHFVVLGLRGDADSNGDRQLTALELVVYVTEHCAKYRDPDAPQNQQRPGMRGPIATDVTLVKWTVAPPATTPATAAGAASRAETAPMLTTEPQRRESRQEFFARLAKIINDEMSLISSDRELSVAVEVDTFDLPSVSERLLEQALARLGVKVSSRAPYTAHVNWIASEAATPESIGAGYIGLEIVAEADGAVRARRNEKWRYSFVEMLRVGTSSGTIRAAEAAKSVDDLVFEESVFLGPDGAAASESSPYAVEIIADEADAPMPIQSEAGLLVVEAPQDRKFQVVLHNKSDYDVAAIVTLDGFSPFSFADDEALRKLVKIVVPRRSSLPLKGWYRTLATQEPFTFDRLPDGQAGEAPLDAMMLHVIFSACWAENERPPPDEPRFSESTAFGAGEDPTTSTTLVKRIFGVPRAVVALELRTRK